MNMFLVFLYIVEVGVFILFVLVVIRFVFSLEMNLRLCSLSL